MANNNEDVMSRRRPLKQRGQQILTRVLLGIVLAAAGCARLPYTTQVVQEDQRVLVVIQREVEPVGYTHPVKLSAQEIRSILKGFSIREKKALPLRWFAEEKPPQPLFREDELNVLVPHLSVALEKVGPSDRVAFSVFAPGFNPAAARDTTSGWIAVRDPYWHLTIDHFHVQLPTRKSDPYDPNYPLVPASPGDYLLTFEPGRFWIIDPATKARAVDYREFLKSAESLPAR
ncbi:MAG TPA: hypothetical protein VNK46_05100 [Nitrospiraceae bacterium]|jgi:hypothetical protein|nr:hypothetical protein [Nitrospiraceae bacterium]